MWADKEVEETCLGATYTMWYTVGRGVRCGPEPAERNVKSQEYAEKNILGYELLLLWQAFDLRHQNSGRARSLKAPVSDGT